ncbi:MAG TPA: type II toxin-antitoxin system VapC family toxin [Acidimicrobiales bacterium]|nr:type II toxin-antitoxin system VapC family toxin [Acidimicrobiales bacterium]
MIVYFDTSAIVPIVIEEPSSPNASRLWDQADRLVSSRLVFAEARAALAMARRLDRLSDAELRTAVQDLESLHQQLDIVEVTDSLVRDAGSLAEELALRGYDAVHLASAKLVHDSDMVFAAGDQALLNAAQAIGIATAKL